MRRHSLVTPIDWKLNTLIPVTFIFYSRHSLVTPIDWKPLDLARQHDRAMKGRHSLVTPIDWKLG